MITAQIISILQIDGQIVVVVSFSDGSNKTYSFSMDTTSDTITSTVQSDLDNKNGCLYQTNNLQTLVGTQLSTSDATMQNFKNNINNIQQAVV